MMLLKIGPSSVLRIPEGWQSFTYRGFLYGRDMAGRWICMAKVDTENKSVPTAKSA